MNILGLKVISHDTGAALISGKRVVAIAEERLCRIKHSHNIYPARSIAYCLKEFGLSATDIDMVVIDQIGRTEGVRMREIFEQNGGRAFARAMVHIVNHHDAHAAHAFFCSLFNDAAVLIVDGAGEKIPTNLGILGTETETLYRGSDNQVVQIRKAMHIRRKTRFPYTTGIGKFYALLSEEYLNFGHYNEGKMMGLAPYGDLRVFNQYPVEHWVKEYNGDILCNPCFRFAGEETIQKKRESFSMRVLRAFIRISGLYRLWLRFSPLGEEMVAEPAFFPEIKFEKPQRPRAAPLPEPYYAAVARAGQEVLERAMVLWGEKIKEITGCRNLCVAGGVGLNIDANKKFLDDVGFERIFIQPAASDTGIALGCALWGAHMLSGLPRFWEMKSASLGRIYSENEIEAALEKYKDKVTARNSDNIAEDSAHLIAEGKIIGWFQGGSEYGPRALGNRSILCDARNPEMANIVNKKVKHREPWRPFAASILAERQREWFELEHPSPFMLLAALVVEEKRALVPSIVHVDGSCRIQSVTREQNAPYYELLSAFEKETGVPLVLNTSFNDAGEPIVETPEDALRCFLATGMDALAMGNYIVLKK
ncbi:MAG: Carbamoyltransferase family protein [Parcubacteria group bacterium GW2011_GWA2_47_12]|nr:MAG: Carbamoyltransferase family protein [Parcubacteria group bacterium GW2011_GWA2_47_12]